MPDTTPGANGRYSVPDSNPFVTDPTSLPEVYAYGVRSPYRMNFDPDTGELYLGDVGAF